MGDPAKSAPWLKRAHHISGMLLIGFISIHLLNHLMILDSVQAHLDFMEVARKVYRFPPIEILLLMAVLFQVGSGSRLLWRKWKSVDTIWDRLQVYSGAYFIYFLIAHPAAVLFGRYVLHLDTNLYYGAAVLNIDPLYYFFALHYGLAITAFFMHTACVHRIKMSAYVSQKNATWQASALILTGILLSIIIVSHMMGMSIPPEYLEGFGGGK
jgi:succinate dehydrogenase/fumarate reductase cytochrome b subunit